MYRSWNKLVRPFAFGAAACWATIAFADERAAWVAAGNLNVPRFMHMATLLKDGRVLVAGGVPHFSSGSLASAELFIPGNGKWTLTGSMNVARVAPSAIVLNDARVLVVGGADNGGAELYDPAKGTWSLVDGPQTPRFGFTLTLLPSGKVLIAGGAGPGSVTYASAEVFDPVTTKWTATGSLISARSSHVATLTHDGQVLVAAGLFLNPLNIEFPEQLQSAELYDPGTGQWRPAAKPHRLYLSPTATLLASGRVLLLGDVGDTEVYDPGTQSWAMSGTRSTGYQRYAVATLPNGKVLVSGGYEPKTTSFVAGTELYDEATGAWTDIAPLNTARASATATTLANGDVLVAGGYGTVVGQQASIAQAEALGVSVRGCVGSCVANLREYVHVATGHYFITTSQDDIDALDSGRIPGWVPTGEPAGAQAWTDGSDFYWSKSDAGLPFPVCRYFIPPDSHFLSASAQECNDVAAQHPEFVLETRAAFYAWLPSAYGICPGDSYNYPTDNYNLIPVYRLWDGRADTNHRFTTSTAVRDAMVADGWIAEGYGPQAVAMCVIGPF